MQSRRDQVQAHAYVLGRLTSALLRAEPDAAETPLRRTTVGSFAGASVAAILVACFAGFGLIFGGSSDAWREPGKLVLEKETGTRYVFLDGTLRPVFNYASARLLLGDRLAIQSASRADLAAVPRGQAVGVLGAPDSLPDPDRLRTDGWLICAGSAPDETGAGQPLVTVQLGAEQAGTPLAADEAVVAHAPDGQLYLAWRARRLRLAAPWVADALGYRGVPTLEAAASWLNALPAGPDLGPVPVPGRGDGGPPVEGRPSRIGALYVVSGPGVADQFYLLRREGLAPVSALQAALVLGDPATARAYGGAPVAPLPLTQAGLAATAAAGAVGPPDGDVPAVPPRAVMPPGSDLPCVRFTAGSRPAGAADGGPAQVDLVFAAPPDRSAAIEDGPGVTRDGRVAGRVAVTPGSGMLARVLAAPGDQGGTIYLITDIGIKYPVQDGQSAAALGYDADRAVLVPSTLLALLPTGPALGTAAAGGTAQPGAAAAPGP